MSRKTKVSGKQSKIDICILEAGKFDVLEACLDALYREAQTTPLSIYIFDNGSDSKERLQYEHLFRYNITKDPAQNVVRFEVKRSQQNLGFPLGANEAARMGRSPLIMFLGDDVELKPGAIETVVHRFDDVSVGVVGAKLMFPKNSLHPNRPAGKVQHVGLTLNVRGEITHPLIGWNPDHPKTSISRDVWAVTGACFTIRRSLFNRFGGFDPVFGLGTCEDVDLCMKVRQAGFRVFLDAEAQGYHYVGASAEKLQVAFPVQQNQQIFMNRWARSGLVYWTEYEYF